MAGYGSDDGFDAWLSERGYSLPSGAPSQAVLRQRGSEYIDGVYGERFPGSPVNGISQDRAWPRSDASDRWGNDISVSTIPDAVINSSYEAAWIEANNDGALSKTYTPAEQKVLTEVKGIKWTVVGDASEPGSAAIRSTKIEGLLYPILTIANLPGALIV